MTYINRALEKTVLDASDDFPVLLITGPRQVGKTTMLRKLASDKRNYVTLDDPLIRQLAVEDPALFLQRYEPPLIIDEIQYAPELLPYIKMHVDECRQSGAFWLTGSQTFHLMNHVSEYLTGRAGILHMPSLSYAEISGRESLPFTEKLALLKEQTSPKPLRLKELYELIFKGSMPALYANPTQNEHIFFMSYMQTYLQRDIKHLTQVGDEMAFLRFISSVAARTGQLLNYADMARDTGISQPTAKQWLSILVTSGLVYLLEPYYSNTLKRIIKTPKMYFLDTGLGAYLTRWTSPQSLEAGAMSGAFFETWVVTEIIKSYVNAGKLPPLYFYRDKDMREIDLLICENDTVYPIEIKKSANPGKEAVKHFEALQKQGLNIGTGAVICMCSELLPIDRSNWYVPAGML